MAISEAMTATPRVKSIQRAALAMLVVAGVINYVDRATLAVANLLIRDDLHLSIADMGLPALGFSLGLCLCATAHGRHGRQARAALAVDLRSHALVVRPASRRPHPELRSVFQRPASFGRGRGAAISNRRARRPGLVQSARPRPRDRHLQLRVIPGHGDRRPSPDLPDAELRLARDVHDHGHCRTCNGGGLVSLLPQSDRSAAHVRTRQPIARTAIRRVSGPL